MALTCISSLRSSNYATRQCADYDVATASNLQKHHAASRVIGVSRKQFVVSWKQRQQSARAADSTHPPFCIGLCLLIDPVNNT